MQFFTIITFAVVIVAGVSAQFARGPAFEGPHQSRFTPPRGAISSPPRQPIMIAQRGPAIAPSRGGSTQTKTVITKTIITKG
uniref:Secreted protein n=1 Tax=Rhabditophanes sp. KR3021 TaxID=114890 RepID=A0AC35U9Q9_9BILA